ncbi:bifunctional UDP-N-acetylglucosamine diphosphorylase/glucosamine-1-phosphate N-acetyltransferase GlmU [Anaeromyxobacter oryzisoli]|uniref:bifunctional UDP-N-acetylglucosamine diphosphorylase/glucosamine-1-phosphate N-acetyltransferase GlmU n=1 Tax=Anaeromyxobacter oryzisoli TaxID=2925408 RepID=UPI001F58F520|nr:bifunctional UDP-N-acetylglucosamine diphosphorylase/glucosamine-1-phosphate N-acetyltransferase GlmU [Anaeromyxobacter sp. SG63]
MTNSRARLAAIVLAAGKGTRMKSQKAKVLHEIAGRPLAWYPVKRALELGADPVVVVVGHQGQAVEAALTAALPGAPLRFAVQAEQLGTAHAVLAAKDALAGHAGPVLILSGDTPLLETATLQAVVDARADAKAPLALATMTLDAPTGYGRVVRDRRRRAQRVVEEKDASAKQRAIREVNAGLYCADAAFLWKGLAKVGAKNAQREFYLTDLVAMGAKAKGGAATVGVPAASAAGVNDRAELARAARVLADRRADALMKAGVSIEDPARFDCDEGVEIAADVTIEPGVRLRGRTRLGAGAVIGAGSILVDATIAEDVTVKPYTVIEDATVARGAILGPFSRLRPGSEIGEEAHVGNFVETKKTRLGQGAKANHLSYLGDAVIGARTNVGAGTITCNYDGEKKNETRIGEDAFIGSDSILVAPIAIGDGAYVAAGSTLTDAVPAGALALGRARQTNKEGWVAAHAAARAAAAPAPTPAAGTGGTPGAGAPAEAGGVGGPSTRQAG